MDPGCRVNLFNGAWRWQLVGYSLFCLEPFVTDQRLRRVNPDLVFAAFVYLDAGLLLNLRSGKQEDTHMACCLALLLEWAIWQGYLVSDGLCVYGRRMVRNRRMAKGSTSSRDDASCL